MIRTWRNAQITNCFADYAKMAQVGVPSFANAMAPAAGSGSGIMGRALGRLLAKREQSI